MPEECFSLQAERQVDDMDRRNNVTSFYIEAVLLILIFVTIIIVLTNVLGLAKKESFNARAKTNAVVLAQNAAEAVEGSKSKTELMKMLDENGNVSVEKVKGENVLSARYDADMKANRKGDYIVYVSWEPKKDRYGTFVSSNIDVNYVGSSIYRLETGVYLKGGR